MKGLFAQRLFFYVLREVAWPFVLWVIFLLLMLFAMQFLRGTEVYLGSAVTGRDMLQLTVYLTPSFLAMAVPVALLLALLLGLGRLGEDRELLAMHALGVSPVQLLAAPFVFSLVLGVVMGWLVAFAAPWGMGEVRAQLNEIIKRNVVGDVKPGTFYEEITQLTLYVERVEGEKRRWRNVLLQDDRDPESPLLVVARQGQVNSRAPGEALTLMLDEGEVHRADRSSDDYSVVEFENGELAVGVADSLKKKNRFRSQRDEMRLWELREEYLRARKDGRDQDERQLRLGWHLRWAQIFTPLSFALIGAPLAMNRQRGGRARGFLLSLAGYISYYILVRLFENLGTQGKLPVLVAAQLPNVVFAVLGGTALWNTLRGETKS